MKKIDNDFIVRFLKKPILSIDKNDLLKLIYVEGDFTPIAHLYIEHKILNSITVELLTCKATDEQVKMILEGSIPLSPDQSPYIVFFVFKSYRNLVKFAYEYIKKGGQFLKKELIKSGIFKDKYFIYLIRLLKNDEEFVAELIASQTYNMETIKILTNSENSEVLFKISKLTHVYYKNPELLEELIMNPYLPDDSKVELKQLVFDIKEFFKVGKSKADEFEEKNEEIKEIENSLKDLSEEEIETMEEKVKSIDIFQKEEDEIEEDLSNNVFILITKMNMPEKMKLALKGNKTARSILIKDSNKQISLAVLKNPGLTDEEIYHILRNKSTGEHIIRNIARNRLLMKDYNVMKSIVMHPKTPVEISLRLLNRLYINDLGILAKSKDVPSNLRTTALRMYEMKSNKGK